VTGTITALNTQRRSGSIRSGDGSVFTFYGAGVIAGLFDFLRIGQQVHFETGHGFRTQNAVRIQSRPGAPSSAGSLGGDKSLPRPGTSGRREASPQFLYSGFDQPQNVRHYRFSSVMRGEPAKTFTVSVDLALFLKHHVGIQEAPALCLKKLGRADPEAARVQQELTDGDLAAYASDRAVAAARKRQRRRWPKSRKTASPTPPLAATK